MRYVLLGRTKWDRGIRHFDTGGGEILQANFCKQKAFEKISNGTSLLTSIFPRNWFSHSKLFFHQTRTCRCRPNPLISRPFSMSTERNSSVTITNDPRGILSIPLLDDFHETQRKRLNDSQATLPTVSHERTRQIKRHVKKYVALFRDSV